MSVRVVEGDCLAELAKLAAEGVRVDAVVTDPPYHLTSIVKRFGAAGAAPAKGDGPTGVYKRASAGFMGKTWDGGDVAFRAETWAAVAAAMKPGAYACVFSGARTFDLTGAALREAGFVMHPFIAWIFGQGFPKATKVKAEGWEGWRYGGQAMKPAIEPILLVQKPMSERAGAANVLKHGTGALNIDGCRIAISEADAAVIENMGGFGRADYKRPRTEGTFMEGTPNAVRATAEKGRWPANVCHDGSDEVMAAFAAFGESKSNPYWRGGISSAHTGYQRLGRSMYTHKGEFHGPDDFGTAARFFYCAKATAADRLGSKHPTVKPVALIRWLVRLITPPGGTVLDPFAGTGTTGQAAIAEGFDAILIEREAEYVADIRARLAHVTGADTPLLSDVNRELLPQLGLALMESEGD